MGGSAQIEEIPESVPLIAVEDLFSLDEGAAWIDGCSGVTVGSVSCPATVASAFCFT